MTVKCLAVTAIFYILAYLAGSWSKIIAARIKSECSPVFRVAFGGCAVLLAGMLSALVSALFKFDPRAGMICFAVTVLALIITGMLYGMRYKDKGKGPGIRLAALTDLYYPLIAAIFIVAQVIAAVSSRFEHTDAYRGLGIATNVYDTGYIPVADPMMLFIGEVSRTVGIHPMSFVFGISPFIFIPLYYLCFIEVINMLCDSGYKRIAAFGSVVLLNVWGYQSDVLIGCTLLVRWFGLGSYIVFGLLNILAVIFTGYLQNRPQGTKAQQNDDKNEVEETEGSDMKKARNLAIAIGALAIVLIAAVFVLNNKINKLYAATVNLQTDMNSRCSIYEFLPDGGESAGYLIKGSDGSLVFIGGGGRENADELSAFLEKYGNNITKWYVYGDDEENAGALYELTDAGLVNAEKMYVMDAKELTKIQ